MKTAYLILSILLLLFCSSCSNCYSYRIYPKKYRKLVNNAPRPKAYIINDSLNGARDILIHADLFTIVTDSNAADVQLQLYPLEVLMGCVPTMIVYVFSFGQIPTPIPSTYYYRFDEIRDGVIMERKFRLGIRERLWFWDIFVHNKRFEEKAGKALLGTYKDVDQ